LDHKKVRKYWNANADAWTHLARAGYDTYRNHLNTPAFLEMLPDIRGLKGVDIGCGEGYNTRLLTEKGAHMTALDIADVFVHHAHRENKACGMDIHSLNASAVELPFSAACFDFATAFMSLMDIAETEEVISEAFRVLKPGGFLQFSIMHPCYDTPHRVKLEHENGIAYAYEVGDYFHEMQGDVQVWQFSAALADQMQRFEPFKVPRFTRTLSHWINLLLDTGFIIERLAEPHPSDQVVAEHPNLQDAQVVAYFLIIRVRKPV
jgi:ubiquinone/menaquinone biosynthesis C-methylase UbiE